MISFALSRPLSNNILDIFWNCPNMMHYYASFHYFVSNFYFKLDTGYSIIIWTNAVLQARRIFYIEIINALYKNSENCSFDRQLVFNFTALCSSIVNDLQQLANLKKPFSPWFFFFFLVISKVFVFLYSRLKNILC